MYGLLQEILVNRLKLSPMTITPEATRDDIDLDSLAVVELAIVLEKEHGIRISDDDLRDAETVAEIVRLMEQSVAAA
ncbi:acyl carrier protein [Micromonospora sp. NPDC003197]